MRANSGQYPDEEGSTSLFSAQNTDVMAGDGAVIPDLETEATCRGGLSDKIARVWVFCTGKLPNGVLNCLSEDPNERERYLPLG